MASKFQVMNVESPVPSAHEVIAGFDTKEAARDYAMQISMVHGGLYNVRANPDFMNDLVAENTVALAMRDAARNKWRRV